MGGERKKRSANTAHSTIADAIAAAALAVVLILVLTLAGCGTDTATYDNVASCQSQVARVNALSCTSSDMLDPVAQCPAAWALTPINYGPYFDCFFAQHTCTPTGNYEFVQRPCDTPVK